jgi:two-component system, OmpR family, phosphate regulon sensor histidine kinase PhoR
MSVLVVDADNSHRESLRAILGEHYTLTFVGGLNEALRALRERLPDMLVSEVDLVDGTGLQLCEQVRELPGGGRLPIMLVTTRSTTADKVAGFQAGADDYVVKPVDTRLFSVRLRLLFRLKGIERPRDLHLPQEA